MERKLVSIQKILNLKPIDGADRIEQATVLGWNMVVKKGEFKEGDLCIFFEIDSILPDGPEWSEFMRSRNFRVKTAKFKGVLAQGLALPLSILAHDHEKFGDIDPRGTLQIGDDVTILLGVIKYEPPMPENQEIEGKFPGEVPKTDEIRLQSIPDILNEIVGVPMVATIKFDGTSSTFFKKDGELIACSRNYRIRKGTYQNKYWRIVKKYDLETIIPEGFAVQGEIVGPKIQENPLGLSEIDFFVFNVYDTQSGQYLDHNEMRAFCASRALKIVPEAYRFCSHDLTTIDFWLQMAEGKYDGTNHPREGIVIRPLKERQSKVLSGRLSFKCISNTYLLKCEK